LDQQRPLEEQPMTQVWNAMWRRPLRAAIVGTAVCLSMPGVLGIAAAQGKAKKGPTGKTPNPPAAAVMAPPEIVVAGIRVVGPGYGDNRKELRPFNEDPGIAVALAIKMPSGASLIKLDNDDCKLTAVADDTGQDLLENGRYGPFPKMSEDGSAGLIEIESKARPATGAQFVTAEGTLVFTASPGTKPQKIAKIKLEKGFAMKIGTSTVTLGDVMSGEDKMSIAFSMTRPTLESIRDIRFLDAAGTALEAHRTERGFMGDAASVVYSIASATKPAAFEFLVWQSPKQQTVPFKVKANLSLR
jgi:hypothetical protein